MPVVAPLVGAAVGIGGSLISSSAQKDATNKAVAAQEAANRAAIAEQQRQFDISQQNFAPWLSAGNSALQSQLALLGLGGHGATAASPGTTNWTAYVQGNPDILANWNTGNTGMSMADYGQYHYDNYGKNEGRDLSTFTTGGTAASPAISSADAQQQAIDGLKSGPLYQSLYHNGEEAILQNAAATGGLRGGNIQRSLANFGQDTLTQVIQNQLANLGGISNTGNSTAGTLGQLGANSANNVSTLLNNSGAAAGRGAILNGGITANSINNITSSLSGLLNNDAVKGALGKIKF